MAKMEIKGIILKSRMDFIQQRYGDEGLRKLLPHLSGKAKEVFSNPKSIRATSWYDFALQTELDRAICKYLEDGDKGIYLKMGEWSADFQESQSPLSEFKGPWKFLQMHSVIFARFFNPGKMELVQIGPSEVHMRLHQFRSNKENCDTNIGFLRRSLEIIGAKHIMVEETMCTQDPKVPYCEYHLKWR
jgi:hypothetical protein